MIFASYEADLTTRMTVKDKPIQLGSFEDIHNSEHKILVRPGNVQHDFLQKAKPGSSLNKIYKSMEPSQLLHKDCKNACLFEMMKVWIQSLVPFFQYKAMIGSLLERSNVNVPWSKTTLPEAR